MPNYRYDDQSLCASNAGDYAELLGAVFGDGSIEKRSGRGWKVSVGSSDKYPAWLGQISKLFYSVFGRLNIRQKTLKNGIYYEHYVTTQDLFGMFRIHAKYDELGQITTPSWVNKDPELRRRFIRGLVETDGCFSITGDKRWNDDQKWPRFSFAQKCPKLSKWVYDVLISEKFAVTRYFSKGAGVWYVRLSRRDQVQRLGEWLQSYKWQALLDSGFKPRLGRNVDPKPAIYWPNVNRDLQDKWRELRTQGASIRAIALHYGKSTYVIHQVVRDIVPVKTSTAEELGLTQAH